MMTGWNNVVDFVRLHDEMARAFGTDGDVAPARRASREGREVTKTAPSWTPPVDIEETQEHIVVRAELAGVKREDVNVTVEDNVLTLAGERRFEHEDRRRDFARVERRYGSFTRVFTLPPTVDAEKIDAKLVDGVLTVTLPKKPETQPRKISIA